MVVIERSEQYPVAMNFSDDIAGFYAGGEKKTCQKNLTNYSFWELFSKKVIFIHD